MNKQEAIEKIDRTLSSPRSIGSYPYDYEDGLRYAKDIINQIDEVEKTIVPWFVADWYEKYKDEFEYYLKGFIAKVGYEINRNTKDEFYQWLGNPHNDSILKLVNMHQFGYEVEKEKRYQIKFIQTRQHLAKNVFLPGEYFVIQANAISSTDSFTRKELEEAGFGWVFDCEGVEVREVE